MKTRTSNLLFQRRKSSLNRIVNEKAKKGYIPRGFSSFGFILYDKKAPDNNLYVVEETTAPRNLKLRDPNSFEVVASSPSLTIFRAKKPIVKPVASENASFEGWQYENEVQWLSEKAAEGFMLDSRKQDEYFFTNAPKAQLEFCIDFSAVTNADDYLKLFASNGWSYVCSADNNHYFCRPKQEARQEDFTPQLNEIRKSLITGNRFAVQSVFSTLIGAAGIVLPIVYKLELGWIIALSIIGAVVFISGVSTLCTIAATNHRLRKRRNLILQKQKSVNKQ